MHKEPIRGTFPDFCCTVSSPRHVFRQRRAGQVGSGRQRKGAPHQTRPMTSRPLITLAVYGGCASWCCHPRCYTVVTSAVLTRGESRDRRPAGVESLRNSSPTTLHMAWLYLETVLPAFLAQGLYGHLNLTDSLSPTDANRTTERLSTACLGWERYNKMGIMSIGPAVRGDYRRLYPANAKTPTRCPSDDNRTKVTNSVTSAPSLWWHAGPYFWPADLTRRRTPLYA